MLLLSQLLLFLVKVLQLLFTLGSIAVPASQLVSLLLKFVLCRMVSSKRLVPGDVIVLLRGKATCDMVLLQGSCLVEESVLSGEVGYTALLGSCNRSRWTAVLLVRIHGVT